MPSTFASPSQNLVQSQFYAYLSRNGRQSREEKSRLQPAQRQVAEPIVTVLLSVLVTFMPAKHEAQASTQFSASPTTLLLVTLTWLVFGASLALAVTYRWLSSNGYALYPPEIHNIAMGCFGATEYIGRRCRCKYPAFASSEQCFHPTESGVCNKHGFWNTVRLNDQPDRDRVATCACVPGALPDKHNNYCRPVPGAPDRHTIISRTDMFESDPVLAKLPILNDAIESE